MSYYVGFVRACPWLGWVYQSMVPMVWHWRVVVVFQLMGLSPRDWLHLRQVTRALSMVSRPPCAYGVTWSGSGLFGCSVVPHARGWLQSGQLVCPAACARCRTRVRHFLWLVVPVRDAVMGSSVALWSAECACSKSTKGMSPFSGGVGLCARLVGWGFSACCTCRVALGMLLLSQQQHQKAAHHSLTTERQVTNMNKTHGTRYTYTTGCRCTECRKANNAYMAQYYRKKTASPSWRAWRSSQRWELWEDNLVKDYTLSARQIAEMLERTTSAVINRRRAIKAYKNNQKEEQK